MKKIYSLLAGTMMLSVVGFAQENQQLNFPHCGTTEATEQALKNNPEAKKRIEELDRISQEQADLKAAAKNNGSNLVNSTVYALDTIPVVFHILHTNGPENISNTLIYQALAQINTDYRKLGSDTGAIDANFKGIAADAYIHFALATKDPNGNCTNGIVRHYNTLTDWDQSTATPPYTGTGAGQWSPKKYLNVYIVKQIIPPGGNTGGGIIVGYTYNPGTWPSGNANDAIIYNYGFLSGLQSRSLAHEMGHWLNLIHTFGKTNSPGSLACTDPQLNDQVADTPPTKGYFSTCPLGGPYSGCSPIENIENIMDYSSCPKMFSQGQVDRMRTCLTSTTSGRNLIAAAANLIATGVRVPQVCAPVADFKANKIYVCANSSVTFSDSTYNAQVTGWSWSFPGGTPSTSTDSMPVIVYSTPGVYAVTYTATNSAGTNVKTKASYINVVSNIATYQNQFSESFESITVPNADWTIDNTGGGVAWVQNNATGSTGTHSMELNNFSNTAGSVDAFFSPSFDLNSIYVANPPVTFTFKLAYQQKASTNADKLQVFSSLNCGQTWSQRYSKSGSLLSTAGTGTSAFTPTSTQWRTETVSVVPVSNQSNVLFKFVFTADATAPGNNIYIDDINIHSSTVGIKENDIANLLNLQVYPNPSAGAVNISFDLYDKHFTNLYVTDILGKTVENVVSTQLNTGNYKYTIGNNKMSSGIYFMNLNVDGKLFTQKIIIE